MNLAWILRMAWRDSRYGRRRLFLYMSSIIMGVAALVSVRSFGENLLDAVGREAKILLGADLALRSNNEFSEEAEQFFTELGGEQARQTSFSSMAYFPKQDATRLVQVRAVSGAFPFYGRLKTRPPSAADTYQSGVYALVDDTLMLQYEVQVGEMVRLGDLEFEIAGRLLEIPGESAAFSDLAPRIYIPGSRVSQTGLIQVGSRVRYTTYFQFEAGVDVEGLVKSFEDRRRELDLSVDTVEERKRDFRRELQNLNRFLGLVGFIALVLGGIGVASSVHLYISQRINTVAILRCVGTSPRQALGIYLVQAGFMGLVGAILGVGLGVVAQRLLPFALTDLLPFEFEQSVSLRSMSEGLFVGLAAAFLFTLIPMAPVRKISPLLTLRSDFENGSSLKRDPAVWFLFLCVLGSLLAFSLWYSATWMIGLWFFAGLVGVFGLLYGVAKMIMVLTKKYFPSWWHYEWRQGLANLHRPHNQTVVLMLAVGLGTFFILTLYLTQNSLLREVRLVGSEERPNLVLFDIQTHQKEPVKSAITGMDLPVMQEVPVVNMRLKSVAGVSVEELRKEPSRRRSRWALLREYRSTYRSSLTDAERLVEGEFQARAGETIQVSVEQGVAERLHVSIGDKLVFDVQGVPVEVEVGSLREVEWRNFQPNFFVVFPEGVLEEAPQFFVLVTRTNSSQESAALQRQVVSKFPNVSAIDLKLVIDTIDSILDRLTSVIRFMALFSIATGLLVMSAAIVSGRFQRIRESILLRTLGASRGQIHRILLIEYLFMGLFSAATGLSLSLIASWAVTQFVFESGFAVEPLALVLVTLIVVGLTVLLGLTNSRGILDQPPLKVLRGED